MPIEVLTREDLQSFRFQLLRDIKQLLEGQPAPLPAGNVLKSTDVMQLLKISKSTLQTLRSNGTIRFSKIGGICYYAYEHIEQLIVK